MFPYHQPFNEFMESIAPSPMLLFRGELFRARRWVVHHGSLRGIPGRTFPLNEVGAAHQAMEDRDFYGKIVIES